MAYQKTIHGQPVSAVDFRRTITESFATMQNGSGVMSDLIPLLGKEWDSTAGRALISKTLVNMARNGTLVRDPDSRGAYRVPAMVKSLGVSSYDKNQKSIVDTLVEFGGFATWAEIMETHDMRPHGPDFAEVRRRRTRAIYGNSEDADFVSDVSDPCNTTAYHQMTHVLKTSEVIRQDYPSIGNKGQIVCDFYNLPIDKLNSMTLRGKFAAVIIKSTHLELGLPGSHLQEVYGWFSNVAYTYRTAREAKGLTLLDLARRKSVYGPLTELARDPRIKTDNRAFYQAETTRQVAAMREGGATQDDVNDYREQRLATRDGVQCMADMLGRFEEGGVGFYGPNLHLRASVALYEALAKELGIDPVAASRGVLAVDTRGPRITVGRPALDWEALGELDAAREREQERQANKRPRIDYDPAVADIRLKNPHSGHA